MPIVIGMDAAWSGLGWAVCTLSGPFEVGHIKLSQKTWRMAILIEQLQYIEHVIAELEIRAHPDDNPPRVVIERAPKVYSRGNQASIGFGLGEIAGAIEVWACRPPWDYPWMPTPDEWRKWWWHSRKRQGRTALKRMAVGEVQRNLWSKCLEPFPLHVEPNDFEGPGVDVAEAILLGMGAARRIASPLVQGEAPAGPAAWKKARKDGTAYDVQQIHPQLFAGRKR